MLINPLIPTLSNKDSVQKALDYMEDMKLTCLPLIIDEKYVGLISEDTLLNFGEEDLLVEGWAQKAEAVVGSETHFLDVIKTFVAHETNLVSVIDSEGVYEGIIGQAEIFNFLAHFGFIQAPGGILVLSIPAVNYSLYEISRIAESNDIKILASFITESARDSNDLWVTLKCSKVDLIRLVASYERYGYHIEAQYHENASNGIEKERLDLLIRYLNI